MIKRLTWLEVGAEMKSADSLKQHYMESAKEHLNKLD